MPSSRLDKTNLGAHVSAAGGLHKAIRRVVNIGGSCLQLFSYSPRSWHQRRLSQDEVEQFLDAKETLTVEPIFFHAVYLINLADAGATGKHSIDHLTQELRLAKELGIAGSIVHLGSYKTEKTDKKYGVLLKNIEQVLDSTPKETAFIIENAGTRKVGKSITEIAQIVKDVNNSRVKVCLDTCHLHAAGYNLSTQTKLTNFLDDLDKKIGMEKLVCWHLNDSRDKRGSLRDRHENIGEGYVGLETFKNILNHPALRKLPMIIETPGFGGQGPDAQNLEILQNLIQRPYDYPLP